MEIEEYDFVSQLMFELNKQKKDNSLFAGGL